MGFESGKKPLQGVGVSVESTAKTDEATIGKIITAADVSFKFMGIAAQSQKLVHDLAKRRLVSADALTWFGNLPLVKSLHILVMATADPASTPPTTEYFAEIIQTAHAGEQSQQQGHLENTAIPKEKLQNFLNDIRGPLEKLESQYANAGDPAQEQAWRIAIADVFTPYENRIAREELDANPDYLEQVETLLGVPTTLTKIFAQTGAPAYGKNYGDFRAHLLQIYADPEFVRLQNILRS